MSEEYYAHPNPNQDHPTDELDTQNAYDPDTTDQRKKDTSDFHQSTGIMQSKVQVPLLAVVIGVFVIGLVIGLLLGLLIGSHTDKSTANKTNLSMDTEAETESETEDPYHSEEIANLYIADRPTLDVELLDTNPYSRPGTELPDVDGIVIHYTANPGTSAIANRNYFNNLQDTKETFASSHFIVGLEGEIVQCIPCDEIAYASNDRNYDTIAIECCIEDDTGEFNSATYDSLVELTAWLVGRYNLEITDVIRHYDVNGKNCPKYYVENEDAWEQFRVDVAEYILEYGTQRGS